MLPQPKPTALVATQAQTAAILDARARRTLRERAQRREEQQQEQLMDYLFERRNADGGVELVRLTPEQADEWVEREEREREQNLTPQERERLERERQEEERERQEKERQEEDVMTVQEFLKDMGIEFIDHSSLDG
jgi:hypothetical protein